MTIDKELMGAIRPCSAGGLCTTDFIIMKIT